MRDTNLYSSLTPYRVRHFDFVIGFDFISFDIVISVAELNSNSDFGSKGSELSRYHRSIRRSRSRSCSAFVAEV